MYHGFPIVGGSQTWFLGWRSRDSGTRFATYRGLDWRAAGQKRITGRRRKIDGLVSWTVRKARVRLSGREMKGANREHDFSEFKAAPSQPTTFSYVWKRLDFGLSGTEGRGPTVCSPRLKFMDIVARTERRSLYPSRLLIPNAAKRPRRTSHNEHSKREWIDPRAPRLISNLSAGRTSPLFSVRASTVQRLIFFRARRSIHLLDNLIIISPRSIDQVLLMELLPKRVQRMKLVRQRHIRGPWFLMRLGFHTREIFMLR